MLLTFPFDSLIYRGSVQSVPVYKGDDDVLDIDVLMELSTGTQERVQSLEVELIRENLWNGVNGVT